MENIFSGAMTGAEFFEMPLADFYLFILLFPLEILRRVVMAHNLLIFLETLAFIYLSFLSGDTLFRLSGRILAPERLRAAYAVMLGMGIFGVAGLLLGIAGLLTAPYLWLFMLIILAISRGTILSHARLLRSSCSFAALANIIKTQLHDHGFFKLIIFVWLAFNFALAFVPITAHDTFTYHLPIITALRDDGRISFSPEIFEYPWMPLMGEIIYAVPTIAFSNKSAPFVFQIIQYSLLPLLLLVVYQFLRDKVRHSLLPLAAVILILGIFDLQREALHSGYTDMFVYLFSIASVLLLIEGCCRRSLRPPDITLSAVFLGIALGVKLTAVFIAATNYLILLAGMVKNRAGIQKAFAHGVRYALIILLIAGFWYAKNATVYGNPLYVGGSELHAGRMAETFVVERTPLNLLLFPYYKFGPNTHNNSLSSTKFIILGYFILVYAALGAALLFTRKNITLAEALLFASIHVQLLLIFFQSHHTRYMLPAIIMLPVLLALIADTAYQWLALGIRPTAYKKILRVSEVCLAVVLIIFFVGDIRYFYVRVLYKTGALNEQEYIKKIGSQ